MNGTNIATIGLIVTTLLILFLYFKSIVHVYKFEKRIGNRAGIIVALGVFLFFWPVSYLLWLLLRGSKRGPTNQ